MKALRLALLAVLLVGSSFVVSQSSQSAGAAEVAAPAPSAKARQRIIPMGPSAVWIGVGCTDAELDVELTVDAVSGEHKIIGEFTRYGRLFGPAVQITVVDAEGSTTYPLDGTAVLIDTSKAVYPVDQSISIPDGVDQISVTGEVLKRYGSGVWCQSSAVDLAIGDVSVASAGYEINPESVEFAYELTGIDGAVTVSAAVTFWVGTPCVDHELVQVGASAFTLTGYLSDAICPQVLQERTEIIDLGEYGPGEHTITINGVEYSFVVDDVVVVQGAPVISVITSVFPAGAVTDCPAQVPVAGLVNDVIPAAVGTDVLYCVWATNAGTADALNVVVANSFDSGVAGPTLPFGTLVPGQTAVDGFVHTTDASPQTSTANITGFDPDGVTPAIGAYTTDPAGVIPPVVDPGVDPGDPVGLAVNGVRFVYDWPQIDETIPVGAEVTFTVGTPCHVHTFTELSVLSWSLVAVPSDDVCPQVVEQRTETIFLGSFPEGDYVLTINGVEYVLALGMVYVN